MIRLGIRYGGAECTAFIDRLYEFIARVLTNHHGQPWIMRRRSQAESQVRQRARAGARESQRRPRCSPRGVHRARENVA